MGDGLNVKGWKHIMKNTLLTFYGARQSKDGKKLNVTLVGDVDGEKTYFNACVKLDNSQRTHAKIDKDGNALLKVPMLKEDKDSKKSKKAKDNVPSDF